MPSTTISFFSLLCNNIHIEPLILFIAQAKDLEANALHCIVPTNNDVRSSQDGMVFDMENINKP